MLGRTLAALGIAALGLFMIAHGLSLTDAAWLNPNPDVPQWVFGVIGAVLLLAALLMVNTLRTLPMTTVNTAGYTIIVLGIVIMHWLAFAATGGTCSLSTGGLSLWADSLLCPGVVRLGVIALDVILLLVLLGTVMNSRKPPAP